MKDGGYTAGSVSLGRRAANGAVWLAATQIVRIVLMFGSTIVVARLLTPSDYGVVAMVAPIIALIAMLQDFGLNAATVQARDLSHDQSTTLFWICASVSLLFAAILLMASPAIGDFYRDGRVTTVAAVSAATVFVGGMALQHSALINRHMKFREAAVADIGGLVATYGTTLVLAFLWHDYWALVAGTFVGACVQTLLTWVVQPFRPGQPRFNGSGHLLRFGSDVAGFNLFNFIARNADTVLVGRFSGAGEAGIYDRSYRLLLLPIAILSGPMGRLLQPVLREVRQEPERYRRVYLASTRCLGLAIIPVSAVTAALAEPFMTLLLGGQWAASGRVYFWLALVGMMQPISNPLGLLYITTGRTREFLYWGLCSSAANLAAFVIAAPFGARGMAMAVFGASLVLLPLRFYLAAKGTAVSIRDLYREQFVPATAAGAVALGAWAAQGVLPLPLNLAGATLLAMLAAFVALSAVSADSRSLNRWMLGFAHDHFPLRLARSSR
jgi:PST family polysaccharide transporter